MSTRTNQLLRKSFAVACVLVIAMAGSAAGKSVYLSANHHTGQFDAWNIGSTGLISKHGTYNLQYSTDPAGIGIDAITDNDEPIMFISSEFSAGLEIVNPVTLEYIGVSPGPSNLGGVDVDDLDNIVYSLRRQSRSLYIFQWDPTAKTMTQLAVVTLPGMSNGYAIALDDSRDILWVGDSPNNTVRAYDVNVTNWADIVEIPSMSFAVSHSPIDVAVDSKRNIVYTSGGWAGSPLLSKYDVDAGVETTVDCGAAMGVAVDEITGYVYITRGGLYGYYSPCHDDIQVWDCSTSPFTLIQDDILDIGNPAGIAIANQGQVVVNPLNLVKNDVVQGVGVPIGQNFTYEITCDNINNSVDVTNVIIRDDLPVELDFVSETIDGVPGTGVYDETAHTVTWYIGTLLAGETGPQIELVVLINDNATEGESIYNFADIWGDDVDTTTVLPVPPCPGCDPGVTPLPPALGDIVGVVSADCPVPGTGLLGVEVDVYDSLGNLIANAVTDVNGYYEVLELDADDYTITVVTPLGYQVSPDEQAVTVVGGDTVIVDFALTCVEITASPRTIGFWKHQVGVATGGKGRAQIDAATLCDYLDLVENHFNGNAINQVIIYQPPSSGLCDDKLQVLKALLNLKGSVDMIDRAKQQLMALLLNVASGKLSQTEIISADGATVSQAITYSDNVIDDPAGNYETAKTICDEINNNRVVPVGMIPLSTADIAYKQGGIPVTYALSQNYPNPFNPQTEISFSLPAACQVTLDVYNIMGQRVATLVDGQLDAGEHTVTFDGRDAASGVYFYRLSTSEFTDTQKMVLLK